MGDHPGDCEPSCRISVQRPDSRIQMLGPVGVIVIKVGDNLPVTGGYTVQPGQMSPVGSRVLGQL